MGGLEKQKRRWDTRHVHWLTDFLDDLRYAVRSLRRTPGLTAFVVMTIALGIGMTTTPFSMLDGLIFRPYPVLHPHDIVSLVSTSRDSSFEHFSFREYQDIRDKTKSYDGVVANTIVLSVGFSAQPGETPRVRGGLIVSGNYFRVLGVEPPLGRGFRDEEDAVPGRDAVVVLGPGFWKSEFSSDPSIIGRTIRLNGKDFTVIGVAPDSFPGMFIFLRPDFYVPLAMAQSFSTDSQKDFFQDRDDRELIVKARLKTGATRRQAQNELAVLAKNFGRNPKSNHGRGARVRTQFEMRTNNDVNWKFSDLLDPGPGGAARGVHQRRRTPSGPRTLPNARDRRLRLALGAGRFRLIRLLMTESLLLALLGGLGGIVVGFASELLSRFQIPSDLRSRCPFAWIDACFWRALACPF
jgi:hypothetical protein